MAVRNQKDLYTQRRSPFALQSPLSSFPTSFSGLFNEVVVFHTNSCTFVSFQTAFWFKHLFNCSQYITPLFTLSNCLQQLHVLVVNNGIVFWKAKRPWHPRLHTESFYIYAIFKSSLNFNLARHWSENWCFGYLKHVLSRTEIHRAVAELKAQKLLVT